MELSDTASFKKKLELIDNILILPGVEIEVIPDIHILLIFDVNADVLNLFDLLKNEDVIVIAAHIDSNKGIYNKLEGNYRGRVFRHERLDGGKKKPLRITRS